MILFQLWNNKWEIIRLLIVSQNDTERKLTRKYLERLSFKEILISWKT